MGASESQTMPELPEVETVARGLTPHLKNRRFKQVELRRKDLRTPFPKDFVKRLEGAEILDISRRAKYLLLKLDTAETLVIHLGMSGTLVLRPKGHNALPEKHDHVLFTLDNGMGLVFNDPRRFGLMDLTGDLTTYAPFMHLGPEPLGKLFNSVTLKASLKGRNTPIKTAIMNQEVVVGVGNIYASESLFLAGISPFRPAKSLKDDEYQALVSAIQKTLKAAIKSGGSTLRDFVRSSGDSGYFQHHFKVYGREGKPCLCGAKSYILLITPLIQKKVQQGRATYYCSNCQK